MDLYIIAGPNGAGKTTFPREFLPNYADCRNFVNADLIAQGIAPFSPETAALRAGRTMLEEIRSFATTRVSFAFETTLSGRSYLTLLRKLKSEGYDIHIFFLWLESVELALSRIKGRVFKWRARCAGSDRPTPFRSIHGKFPKPDLEPLGETTSIRYEIPASGPVALVHTGIPLDEVEDLLLDSSAYRQASRILLPRQQDVRGRPLTPLHGGHVGLLCTAGMLNGVFGVAEDRHIAHWRSVKFTDHWQEEEADGTHILHDRERFSHELTLVFANGKTQILTHGDFTPVLAKHSKSFSLIDGIAVGMDRMQRNFDPMRRQVEAWQRSELTDVTAKVVIYEAFVEGKLEAPKHLARTVHDLYFEPKYEEFRSRTIWSLSNAFTSAFKELDPIPQFKVTAKLGEFLETRFSQSF